MLTNINNCPFCGSKKVDISIKTAGRWDRYYYVSVYCKDCHAYGPRVISVNNYTEVADTDKLEAISKWNTLNETATDGYHSFSDLYYQRLILSAALAKNNPYAWKSLRHNDGSVPFGGGWFIMGFETPDGSYTYHYELKDWDLFQCKELERGKPWDGHTSKDVRRLLSM